MFVSPDCLPFLVDFGQRGSGKAPTSLLAALIIYMQVGHMAREAVDFLRMGNGDQVMKDTASEVLANPTSSPEQEQLPRSPASTSAPEGEAPSSREDVGSKAEEHKSETEAERKTEVKMARDSPPRSPAEAPPATGGIQVTEEEYRLLCQFRGMQHQQQAAKVTQARQQERSAMPSPTRNGGEAPSTCTSAAAPTAAATSAPLRETLIIDQHNRKVQAKFTQALHAENQNKQESPAGQAQGSRPYTPTSPALLSLAIPNGHHFQSGFVQQGGFGSPIPGLHRGDARHAMLSGGALEPNPSLYMASPNRLLQASTVPASRSGSPQPAALPRSNGAHAPGVKVSAQLTIFYAGQVNVYDDVPVDKARAIMLLAGSESTFSYNQPPGGMVPAKMPIVAPSAASAPAPIPSSSVSGNSANKAAARPRVPAGITPAELPQARKLSLARFLEKRKDRSRTKAPYPSCSNGDKKFPPFDTPPSPQNLSAARHSSCPSSAPSSPMMLQPSCGEPGSPLLQGHGAEDHGGVGRKRCSGLEAAAGNDSPSASAGLQPQLQQQQVQIH